MKKRSILLIGNGPSTRGLADIGFDKLPDNIDTFGMGAAYRYYEKVGWWPRYYAWCDQKVCYSHFNALGQLTENPDVPVSKFFFSLPVSLLSDKLEVVPHSSTGDFCFRKAVELGYRRIYLIGIESNYVEELPESRALSESEWRSYGNGTLSIPDEYRSSVRLIMRTPVQNPNYFFERYQREGDHYSLPKNWSHLNSWKACAKLAQKSRIQVVNLSPISKIEHFKKSMLSSLWERPTFPEYLSAWIQRFTPLK